MTTIASTLNPLGLEIEDVILIAHYEAQAHIEAGTNWRTIHSDSVSEACYLIRNEAKHMRTNVDNITARDESWMIVHEETANGDWVILADGKRYTGFYLMSDALRAIFNTRKGI